MLLVKLKISFASLTTVDTAHSYQITIQELMGCACWGFGSALQLGQVIRVTFYPDRSALENIRVSRDTRNLN